MPCNSDYMERNGREIESVRTAEALHYILLRINKEVPDYVAEAATSYYGNVNMLDDMVVMLCGICESFSESEKTEFIYDGRNPKARILAEWWDNHEKADIARKMKEERDAEVKRLKSLAMSKLSAEELIALGLKL